MVDADGRIRSLGKPLYTGDFHLLSASAGRTFGTAGLKKSLKCGHGDAPSGTLEQYSTCCNAQERVLRSAIGDRIDTVNSRARGPLSPGGTLLVLLSVSYFLMFFLPSRCAHVVQRSSLR
jgi:hypothetical protein